jgi:hypothetical protein
VTRSLRKVLADSHVAAVAIALLLLWTFDSAFRGLWDPVYRAVVFVFTAIAIWDIPYFSFTTVDRLMLIRTCYFLYSAIATLAAASLLSRWVYGRGPVAILVVCISNLRESKNV